MPATYNPEEIARAKHLVALAEQINTRLNRRLPRLVSCSYLMDNKYITLDTQSASWSIPCRVTPKIISFRIVSPHEDGTPTITLSNGVTSNTISSSNFSFYLTLTVPNNVTSFTMTISLPQTDTFQAWQKTVNVDTATDKGKRSISWKYSADGTNYTEVDPYTMEIPASAITQSNALNLRIVSVTGEDGLPFFSMPSGVQLRFGQVVWIYGGNTGAFSVSLPSNSPQDLTFTVRFDETEKFVALERPFTFHLVGGE